MCLLNLCLFILSQLIWPIFTQETYPSCLNLRPSQKLDGCHEYVIYSFAGDPQHSDYILKSLIEEPLCTVFTIKNLDDDDFDFFWDSHPRKKLPGRILHQFNFDSLKQSFNIREELFGSTSIYSNYYFYLDSDKNLIIYRCLQINETIKKEMAVLFRRTMDLFDTDQSVAWEEERLEEFLKNISSTALTLDSFTKHYKKYEEGKCSNYGFDDKFRCLPRKKKNESLPIFLVCLAVSGVALFFGVIISVYKREDSRVHNIN